MTSWPDSHSASTQEALGLGSALAESGLNVAGALSPDDYNAIVPAAWQTQALHPTAATVFVIGSGGGAFYAAARAAFPDSEHPLDDHCEAVMAPVVEELGAQGSSSRALFYWQKLALEGAEAGVFADFVALARAAGLGSPSRLGLLLHPRYGPWFAIRALLLSDVVSQPTGQAADSFDPCGGCEAPCIATCHGRAVSREAFAAARCAETRHSNPQCAERCDARLACPVGGEHRYDASALAHHMTAHFRSLP